MKDYITIGPTPCKEPCAQVGEPNYREKAVEECRRFLMVLRKKFGPEPEGAWLSVKWFSHDSGHSCAVVCYYNTDMPASVDYARRCKSEAPATWEEAPKTCPQCGKVLKTLLFMGLQPDGYVCDTCQVHYSDELKPLAHIIG